MPFSLRLNLLMNTLGVSNSRLAKVLSVDASLVSRWRTGARTPAKDNTHIAEIASYFAEHAKMDYQKAALCEIMGLPADKCVKETHKLAEFLYSWLCDESLPDTKIITRFLDNLGTFKATKNSLPPSDERKAFPAGMVLKSEVFYGINGKQNSVIRFLSAVGEHKKPCTLLLYSDENIEWFAGDRLFLASFVQLLVEVISKGNKIKIIHTISRDMSEMFAAIDFWLPLYMTGAIEPYYCPRYREHYFRRTMFIASGVAAVVSTTLSGWEKNAANLFCTDPGLIESLTGEFNEYLNMCRPLMSIFASSTSPELANLLTEFEEQPGDCFVLSNTLSAITMPEGLFDRLLSRAGADSKTKEKMLSVQRARYKVFAANLKHHNYTEIVFLPSPEEITTGRIPVELPEIPGGTTLCYTPQDYREHLENIIGLLNHFDKFSFFICRRGPNRNIHLAVKDEIGVIVTKTDAPVTVFAFNQQNMTNAFYCYLEDFINNIPQAERDKKKVIEKLSSLAGSLSNEC